jgi:hypothetical protein
MTLPKPSINVNLAAEGKAVEAKAENIGAQADKM